MLHFTLHRWFVENLDFAAKPGEDVGGKLEDLSGSSSRYLLLAISSFWFTCLYEKPRLEPLLQDTDNY